MWGQDGYHLASANPRDPAHKGLASGPTGEQPGCSPQLPSQSPPLAVSSLATQQRLSHVQVAPVPTAHTTASSLSTLPCHRGSVTTINTAGGSASAGGARPSATHPPAQPRVHGPRLLPHPPICSLNLQQWHSSSQRCYKPTGTATHWSCTHLSSS